MVSALCDMRARFVKIKKGTKQPAEMWMKQAKPYLRSEIEKLTADYNIGVVADDRLVFLDVEGPKKGAGDGLKHIAALQIGYESLPETLSYSTPSGGKGYIFRGKGVPFVDRSKEYGLELRTGNHFSIIPPSTYEGPNYGGTYEWDDEDAEIAEVPGWLIEWFTSDKRAQATSVASCDDPTLQSVIENNIWSLDPDLSYSDWWRVMCVCHKLGASGLKIFDEWSKGGTKYDANYLQEQWQTLDKRMVEEQVGLPWFLEFVDNNAANKPLQNLPERLEKPKPKAVETDEDPVEIIKRKWPLVGLSGALEHFRQRLERFSPEQTEANYAVPLICLQAALQRKIIFDHGGLQGHWWALIGPAASGKTSYSNIIKQVIKRLDTRMLIDSFESPNGLKSSFAEFPSRLLVMDEGLKAFNTALANESKNSFDAKVISLILNMHNNKSDIEETGNKTKAYRIPRVVFPQLQIVTFDQKSYWEVFRTSSAALNGMVSRFGMFELKQCHPDSEYNFIQKSEFDAIARKIALLVPSTPIEFNTATPNDLHSWSPVDPFNPSDFGVSQGALDVLKLFRQDLREWASSPENDEELANSIMSRSVGFALLVSQLLSKSRGGLEVSELDAKQACGVVALSVANLGKIMNPEQFHIIMEVQEVLRARGPLNITQIIKGISSKYRRSKGDWENTRRVIETHFQKGNGKVLPLR